MPAGRPLGSTKFESEEELKTEIDAYFAQCAASEKPPTISGLAYHLEITTETLRNYEQRDKFFATVKRAKQKVEMHLEERLNEAAPTGAIFNLKNNFGWKDKTEQELSGGLTVTAVEREIIDEAEY